VLREVVLWLPALFSTNCATVNKFSGTLEEATCVESLIFRDLNHRYVAARLRVVPLSLSPSCVTLRLLYVTQKWPREILGARSTPLFRVLLARRISRGHFCVAHNGLSVTHDGLSERGTARSLHCSHPVLPMQSFWFPSDRRVTGKAIYRSIYLILSMRNDWVDEFKAEWSMPFTSLACCVLVVSMHRFIDFWQISSFCFRIKRFST